MSSRSKQQPHYLPSRREIALACEKIQADWTPETRKKRTVGETAPFTIPHAGRVKGPNHFHSFELSEREGPCG